jgi:hypothetical protein
MNIIFNNIHFQFFLYIKKIENNIYKEKFMFLMSLQEAKKAEVNAFASLVTKTKEVQMAEASVKTAKEALIAAEANIVSALNYQLEANRCVEEASMFVDKAQCVASQEEAYCRNVEAKLPSDKQWLSFNFFGKPVQKICHFLEREKEITVYWLHECEAMSLGIGNGYALQGASLSGNRIIGWVMELPY